MAEVLYTGNWQPDVKAIVEVALTPHLHLIPGWCRSLYIRFESGNNDNDSAGVRMSYEYRHAVMYIRPSWLEELSVDREKAIIHEIIHLHIQPMRLVFHDLCSKGIENQAFKDFAWERFKEAWEGAIEDLTWAFTTTKEGNKNVESIEQD